MKSKIHSRCTQLYLPMFDAVNHGKLELTIIVHDSRRLRNSHAGRDGHVPVTVNVVGGVSFEGVQSNSCTSSQDPSCQKRGGCLHACPHLVRTGDTIILHASAGNHVHSGTLRMPSRDDHSRRVQSRRVKLLSVAQAVCFATIVPDNGSGKAREQQAQRVGHG